MRWRKALATLLQRRRCDPQLDWLDVPAASPVGRHASTRAAPTFEPAGTAFRAWSAATASRQAPARMAIAWRDHEAQRGRRAAWCSKTHISLRRADRACTSARPCVAIGREGNLLAAIGSVRVFTSYRIFPQTTGYAPASTADRQPRRWRPYEEPRPCRCPRLSGTSLDETATFQNCWWYMRHRPADLRPRLQLLERGPRRRLLLPATFFQALGAPSQVDRKRSPATPGRADNDNLIVIEPRRRQLPRTHRLRRRAVPRPAPRRPS